MGLDNAYFVNDLSKLGFQTSCITKALNQSTNSVSSKFSSQMFFQRKKEKKKLKQGSHSSRVVHVTEWHTELQNGIDENVSVAVVICTMYE